MTHQFKIKCEEDVQTLQTVYGDNVTGSFGYIYKNKEGTMQTNDKISCNVFGDFVNGCPPYPFKLRVHMSAANSLIGVSVRNDEEERKKALTLVEKHPKRDAILVWINAIEDVVKCGEHSDEPSHGEGLAQLPTKLDQSSLGHNIDEDEDEEEEEEGMYMERTLPCKNSDCFDDLVLACKCAKNVEYLLPAKSGVFVFNCKCDEAEWIPTKSSLVDRNPEIRFDKDQGFTTTTVFMPPDNNYEIGILDRLNSAFRRWKSRGFSGPFVCN